MKVLVAVKRVIASSVKVSVKTDQTGVVSESVKMAMNDFDEVAVEQAIRLKEASIADEVIIVSIGPAKAKDIIQHGLSLGADRGILIQTDAETEPLAVAKALKKIVEQESIDLVLMGKQAIDNDASQAPQMLAGLLNWPQATFVSSFNLEGNHINATREVDQGLQYLSFNLPAVISVDLRLNTPRYANMPSIMKAKRKPLDVVLDTDLGVDFTPKLQTLKVTEPPSRGKGQMLDNVEDLLHKLSQKGVL
ncbi:electron transfer flavoprotein subunit beta/FixA family protein [Facilibium subflavum]|uniref:electron transfer flavoprotein subunit beta/FixA family protein n=1 Tax=Facilibium subflavum TaxID=2219058 RepID=UPI000E65523B|nr:electron transfer flavoprotein subunit beta/FixA family protein [Facilibium subflavum]